MSKITTVTIGDSTVSCTEKEFELLSKVCKNFMGYPIPKYAIDDKNITHIAEPFSNLNKPTIDDELDISMWDGYGMTNEEADKMSLETFGVYFNVLIFLDNGVDMFRTN